jgi:hypothetical protein
VSECASEWGEAAAAASSESSAKARAAMEVERHAVTLRWRSE